MLENVLNVGWAIGGFVLALGLLVAFHEYGHFWVARRLGVKVLRYSVGFGKPIWMRTAPDGTEYAIARIPLGGYVRFADEREGEVAEADLPRAFNRQSVWTRIAIVSAGPLANFLLAIVVYWVVYLVGVTTIAPSVGTVPPGTVAYDAGLRGGEVVTALDGRHIESWDELRPALIEVALKSAQPELVANDATGTEQRYTLDLRTVDVDPQVLFGQLGLRPDRPVLAPVLDTIVSGGAAQQAGYQAGDTVVSVAGEPVTTWTDFVQRVRARPGQMLDVTVERSGQLQTLPVLLGTAGEGTERYGSFGASVRVPPDFGASQRIVVRRGPLEAVPRAIEETWRWSVLTVKLLGRLVTGEVSVKNVSGPLQIAEVTGTAAQIGPVTFLTVMAIISISLGVLNLLPVPVLDGGHLLYYLVELVKGSPVSETTQIVGQQVGLVLLFMLMSLAFYNDISRLVGS